MVDSKKRWKNIRDSYTRDMSHLGDHTDCRSVLGQDLPLIIVVVDARISSSDYTALHKRRILKPYKYVCNEKKNQSLHLKKKIIIYKYTHFGRFKRFDKTKHDDVYSLKAVKHGLKIIY